MTHETFDTQDREALAKAVRFLRKEPIRDLSETVTKWYDDAESVIRRLYEGDREALKALLKDIASPEDIAYIEGYLYDLDWH